MSRDQVVIALDMAGVRVWRAHPPKRVDSVLAVGDRVFVGTAGEGCCLKKSNGETVWRQNVGQGRIVLGQETLRSVAGNSRRWSRRICELVILIGGSQHANQGRIRAPE